MEEGFHELERGRIRFYVRPRVEVEAPQSFADVQRFFFSLLPRGGGAARRVGVGRKRMPDARVRERLWGYVDRVGDVASLLDDVRARSYETKTRGLRHQAGAVIVARGTYAIAGHRDHAHLLYELDEGEGASLLCRQLRLEREGGCIAAVFNPESKWKVRDQDQPETPFRDPSIYDDELQARFGDRRFAPLHPSFLDHEGAELVLIGGGESRNAEAAAALLSA